MNIMDIINVPPKAAFTYFFRELKEMDTEERDDFLKRIKHAYLQTSVAARNYNLWYFERDQPNAISNWQERNRQHVAKFVEMEGWKHIY